MDCSGSGPAALLYSPRASMLEALCCSALRAWQAAGGAILRLNSKVCSCVVALRLLWLHTRYLAAECSACSQTSIFDSAHMWHIVNPASKEQVALLAVLRDTQQPEVAALYPCTSWEPSFQ